MVTNHSLTRAKERLGLSRGYAVNFIERGINRGKDSSNFKADEKIWLESRSLHGCNALVYNGACLIVSPAGACITIYKLPAWFGRKRQFDHHKEKVKNAIKYQRMWYAA